MSQARIMNADVLAGLAQIDSGSVQCVVTSPPYWGLRDYGTHGQIGLEATPEAYVTKMVEVFREVRRVMADDATLWLNLGDSYAAGTTGRNDAGRDLTGGGGNHKGGGPVIGRVKPENLKPKDLVGIPWRVAFALQADGWWLRSDIIWAKPNPMPESVTDRPTKAHEYLFLMAKRERYYYNADAIAEPSIRAGDIPLGGVKKSEDERVYMVRNIGPVPENRNKRTVWTVTSEPFPGAHFATFPQALVEPCILAGSKPGDLVLDPFAGSGTVGIVALRHGRRFVGVELNPTYATMARRRILGPLFAEVGHEAVQ